MTEQQINGAVIKTALQSGVEIHITPLSVAALRAITAQAEKLFPYPDPKAYEKPMEGALPGSTATQPAQDNPEYLALLVSLNRQRTEYMAEVILRVVVTCPSEDAVVALHKTQLETARRLGTLNELEGDSDFQLVLTNFLVTVADINLIMQASQRNVMLTAEEVRDGRAYFRLALTRDTPREGVGNTRARRAITNPPIHKEPVTAGNRDGESLGETA